MRDGLEQRPFVARTWWRSSAHGLLAVVVAVALGLLPTVARADSLAVQDPPDPTFGVVAGSEPTPTQVTVPHWRDTFTDPTNGVTYGANLVGAEDPRTPGAGTTTIQTEIIPINLSFDANGGEALNGSDVTQATVDSPIFNPTDWSAVSNNTGVQFQDAVMRSQFNQVGSSPFHLQLAQPTVTPNLTIEVPQDKGVIRLSHAGAPFGCVDGKWLFDHIWSALGSMHIDPTSLPIFLTNDVLIGLVQAGQPCIPSAIAMHGAGQPGNGSGAINGQGNPPVFTWIIASYDQPQLYGTRRPDVRDVNALSHELSEWADDPFGTNKVQPYAMPSPRYPPCFRALETGDAAVDASPTLDIAGNPYFQTGANAPFADGTYHFQDEVFLPWFARESPNLTSEPEGSSGHGRYTFFGDFDTNPAFHGPATACQ
jgi:hypothetical protein